MTKMIIILIYIFYHIYTFNSYELPLIATNVQLLFSINYSIYNREVNDIEYIKYICIYINDYVIWTLYIKLWYIPNNSCK